MEKYNQHLYKNICLGFSDKAENNWCAICSLSYSLTKILGEYIYPKILNILLKKQEGFIADTGIVIWKYLEKIFPIKVEPYLFDRKTKNHYDLELINKYDIISVDGKMVTDEYDSHFVSVNSILYNETKLNQNGQKQIRDINIFDPWVNNNILLKSKYLKENLKNSVFTIINIERIKEEEHWYYYSKLERSSAANGGNTD